MAFVMKDCAMKLFGTVKSFDTAKRNGSIKPEGGGEALGFESSAFNWADKAQPIRPNLRPNSGFPMSSARPAPERLAP